MLIFVGIQIQICRESIFQITDDQNNFGTYFIRGKNVDCYFGRRT
jgi:hypothetical protein